MMLVDKLFKNDGSDLVNKFSHTFSEVLGKTFKDAIKKIQKNPETVRDYPLSI